MRAAIVVTAVLLGAGATQGCSHALAGKNSPNPATGAAITAGGAVVAYLGKRQLITGQRPWLVVCGALARDPSFIEGSAARTLHAGGVADSITLEPHCTQEQAPRARLTVIVYGVESTKDSIRISAGMEAPSASWSESALLVGGAQQQYVANISFSDFRVE